MASTRAELQRILELLPEGEWNNAHITSWEEDARAVYTLLATKPDTGKLYYYEQDSSQFELLKVPGQ